MKKIQQRTGWWLATVIYIAFIYATLGVAPEWWKRIDAALGGNGVLVQHVLYASVAGAIFLYLVYIKKENSLVKYFWFFACIGLAWGLIKAAPFPAEKIHLAEYGLLGVLFYNALKIDIDRLRWELYLAGALLCMAIGAMDEAIQFVLPNRYFGWRDLFMNGASGALALWLIRFSILKDEL